MQLLVSYIKYTKYNFQRHTDRHRQPLKWIKLFYLTTFRYSSYIISNVWSNTTFKHWERETIMTWKINKKRGKEILFMCLLYNDLRFDIKLKIVLTFLNSFIKSKNCSM